MKGNNIGLVLTMGELGGDGIGEGDKMWELDAPIPDNEDMGLYSEEI